MKQVIGYRRITNIGTAQAVYVTSLIKDSGIKRGDLVKVTIEAVPDDEGGLEDGYEDDKRERQVQMQSVRTQGGPI